MAYQLNDDEKIISERVEVTFPGYDNFKKHCEELVPIIKNFMGEEYKDVYVELNEEIPTFMKSTLLGMYKPCSGSIIIYLATICRRYSKQNMTRLLVFVSTLIHELVHSNRSCSKRYQNIFPEYAGYKSAIETDCRIQTLKIFTGFINTKILSSRPYFIHDTAIKYYIIELKSEIIKWYLWTNEYKEIKNIGIDLDDEIMTKLNNVLQSISELDIFRNVPEYDWGNKNRTDPVYTIRKAIVKRQIRMMKSEE